MPKYNSKILFELNKIKGKIAEEIAKQDYIENGFEVKKTGIGSDFIVIKNTASKKSLEYVDVKFGDSQLTKKQKLTKTKLRRKGIPYSIYRVTPNYLKHQIQHNKQLSNIISKFNYQLDRFWGTFLIEDPTCCPNCKKISQSFESILINFGLRNMGDGTVRVQSWCRACRCQKRSIRN